MADKKPSLEDILDGPLKLIYQERAAQLQRFEATKKELNDFVEKIKSDNPRPNTAAGRRTTRSQSQKCKKDCSMQPCPSKIEDLDDFDRSLNESLAQLDRWVEDKQCQSLKNTRNGLEVIFEAVDEVFNQTTEEQRSAVIVPNADTTLFQATNSNPVVNAEKKLGARPKESKARREQKNFPTFSTLDETSFDKLMDYPTWSTERIATCQNIQSYVDPAVILNLFPIRHADFDLKDVFPDSNISPEDLKRRSSANWGNLREAK